MKLYILIILLFAQFASAEYVKFYFEINKPIGAKEFAEVARKYQVDYIEVNQRNNKYLYIGVIPEPDDIEKFTEELSDKKPKILGSFKFNGLQYGKSKKITPAEYDKDGKITKPEVIEKIGTAKHKFEKVSYINMMRDVKTFDGDGVELTSTRPVKEKMTHNILGWGTDDYPQ